MILWYSFKDKIVPLPTLTAFYYSFTGVLGLSLSSVFAIYSATSIVEAFLTTTLLFGAMPLMSTITKRDLSGLGSLLFFGLVGVIIASLNQFIFHEFSFFIGSSALLESLFSLFLLLMMYKQQNKSMQKLVVTKDMESNLQSVCISTLSIYFN